MYSLYPISNYGSTYTVIQNKKRGVYKHLFGDEDFEIIHNFIVLFQ